MERDKKSTLMEIIMKKKSALRVAFESIDTESKNIITRVQWAEIMQRVTVVKIRWLGLLASLTPPESLTPTTVNYHMFLEKYTVKVKTQSANSTTG